jgi:hypothetical protein
VNVAIPTAPGSVGASRIVALSVVAALAVVLAFPQPAGAHRPGRPHGGPAGRGGPVNLALALNTGHQDRETRLAWGVRETYGLPAVADNTAVAFARGRNQTAAAVAIQVVLASNAHGDVHARNTADARSWNCSHCSTVAAAYQFVITSEDDLSLSRSTRARLADVRRDIAAVLRSDAGGHRIMNATESAAKRVRKALAADLDVRVPPPPKKGSTDAKGV